MVQKLTKLFVTDGSGLRRCRTIHLYRGYRRRFSRPGFFVRSSVERIRRYPPKIAGKRYKPIRRGWKMRGLILQNSFKTRLLDRADFRSRSNTFIILKRKRLFYSKYVYGHTSYYLPYKRYRLLNQTLVF